MSFLALLLALAVQQVLSPGNALQARGGLLQWDRFLARHIPPASLRVAAVLVSLVVAGHWLLRELAGWSFALPVIVADAAMLLWSLGSRDYHTALERFEARHESDPAGAVAGTLALWMPTPAPSTGGDAVADHDLELARQRLLYAGYARWFAPVFYYVLAGPLAAVVYRATAVLAADGRDASYLRLLAVLDWLPARLLCLSFALTGDFPAVVQRAGDRTLLVSTAAPGLLRACAVAACGRPGDARAAADLLYRSAGLWLLLLFIAFLLF